MTVIHRDDGKWVLVYGPTANDEMIFNSETEARMAEQKQRFAQEVRNVATQMTALIDKCEMIDGVWNARLYGPGGANQLTDAEVAPLGMTADQAYGFVILCSGLLAWFDAGRKATINNLRTDV
jgi:hypothetical protein